MSEPLYLANNMTVESDLEDRTAVHCFKLIGGQLCLDFANTVKWRLSGSPRELLETYEDLAAWGRLAGLISSADIGKMERLARERPKLAGKSLQKTLSLRDAIFSIFHAVASAREPEKEDLGILNRYLAQAMSRSNVIISRKKFSWEFMYGPDPLSRIVWPVVSSAAELLVSENLDRLKVCSEKECGFLFMDTSRNRSSASGAT